jgi:hypothetical protein
VFFISSRLGVFTERIDDPLMIGEAEENLEEGLSSNRPRAHSPTLFVLVDSLVWWGMEQRMSG